MEIAMNIFNRISQIRPFKGRGSALSTGRTPLRQRFAPPSPLAGEDFARRAVLAVAALLAFASPAHAERIKDLGTFQGVRPNQLTGYGIVVGLAGTGDDSLDYATQGMKGVVSRFERCRRAGDGRPSRFLQARPAARRHRLRTW
jgi:flagellar P-ring protein precursor FlgI